MGWFTHSCACRDSNTTRFATPNTRPTRATTTSGLIPWDHPHSAGSPPTIAKPPTVTATTQAPLRVFPHRPSKQERDQGRHDQPLQPRRMKGPQPLTDHESQDLEADPDPQEGWDARDIHDDVVVSPGRGLDDDHPPRNASGLVPAALSQSEGATQLCVRARGALCGTGAGP